MRIHTRLAPGVQKVLKEFETDRLRLYPDPASSELVDAIASEYGVRSSQVFAGVGSDDVHCNGIYDVF